MLIKYTIYTNNNKTDGIVIVFNTITTKQTLQKSKDYMYRDFLSIVIIFKYFHWCLGFLGFLDFLYGLYLLILKHVTNNHALLKDTNTNSCLNQKFINE